jgi:hypothetical protein
VIDRAEVLGEPLAGIEEVSFPTTSGSVRNANTVIGPDRRAPVGGSRVEQRGQARASTESTRRRSCVQGTRRRQGEVSPAAGPPSCSETIHSTTYQDGRGLVLQSPARHSIEESPAPLSMELGATS